MILVLDNYDSFTYNLVQYLGELGADLQVRRNDEISIEQIRALKPERILVSPGPCSPREAGLSNDVIRTFASEGIPIFGVCLGHQCIGHTFGADVVVNYRMMHGKTSPIKHNGKDLFAGIGHRLQIHVRVVNAQHPQAENLIHVQQMPQIGARKIFARVTFTAFLDR